MQPTIPPTDLATIDLKDGASLLSAPGRLAWMSANIRVKTRLSLSHNPDQSAWRRVSDAFWGFWRNFGRRIRGKEALLLHSYTPQAGAGRVVLAPPLGGEIYRYTLQKDEGLAVASACFIACAPTVRLAPEGERFSLLRALGPGDIWLAGCGNLLPLWTDGSFLLQAEHVVAFAPKLSYQLREEKNPGSLEVEFFGEGEVWLQTRRPGGFFQKLLPRLAA